MKDKSGNNPYAQAPSRIHQLPTITISKLKLVIPSILEDTAKVNVTSTTSLGLMARANVTIYIRNEGNAPIILHLNTTNRKQPQTTSR